MVLLVSEAFLSSASWSPAQLEVRWSCCAPVVPAGWCTRLNQCLLPLHFLQSHWSEKAPSGSSETGLWIVWISCSSLGSTCEHL